AKFAEIARLPPGTARIAHALRLGPSSTRPRRGRTRSLRQRSAAVDDRSVYRSWMRLVFRGVLHLFFDDVAVQVLSCRRYNSVLTPTNSITRRADHPISVSPNNVYFPLFGGPHANCDWLLYGHLDGSIRSE